MKMKHRARGFTLLELLVVLMIMGILLGGVSVSMMPDDRRIINQDAQRLSLLMQLARDEAILRSSSVAMEIDSTSYRFLIKKENEWVPIKDDLLRERQFTLHPIDLQIQPDRTGHRPIRIVFGREPVDRAFELTMSANENKAVIRADGIGHFYVE